MVAPIKFTTTSWLTSGFPRQESRRTDLVTCLVGFFKARYPPISSSAIVKPSGAQSACRASRNKQPYRTDPLSVNFPARKRKLAPAPNSRVTPSSSFGNGSGRGTCTAHLGSSPPGSCDWLASYSPCRGAVRLHLVPLARPVTLLRSGDSGSPRLSAPPAGPSLCSTAVRPSEIFLPYGRLSLPLSAPNRSRGKLRFGATTPGRRRLSGKHQSIVHNGGNRLVTSLNRSFNYHPLSIAEHVVKVKLGARAVVRIGAGATNKAAHTIRESF